MRRTLEAETLNTPQAYTPASASDCIKTVGRDVYFYTDVSAHSVLLLIETLRAVDAATTPQERDLNIPIRLHICSDGGEVFAMLAVIDQIKLLRSETHSIVSGCACSAATFLALCCTKRYILPSSFMMIHEIHSAFWGGYRAFKDEIALLDRLMDIAARFYTQHSKLSDSVVREMLTRNTWIDAGEALQFGFVDEIISLPR